MATHNTQPYEIVAGPADIYFAPTGTSFPAIDVAPGTEWIRVGQTEGGVQALHSQTVVELRTDQVTAPVKAIRSEESLELSTEIASVTLENYALALNQAISGPDTSVPGEVSVKLYRGGSQVETFALLVRNDHLSPYGDFALQYEAPNVFQAGNPQVAYVKDNKAVLAVSFHAIAADLDPGAADFGTLRAGSA